MPFKRKRSDLVLGISDREKLERLRTSRNEPHSNVVRAMILLRYADGDAINAIAKDLKLGRPAVERCVDKALSAGIDVAVLDLRRKGRPPVITADDKAWVINMACQKPKDLGYSYESWTVSLLVKHVQKNAAISGHGSLVKAGKSLIHNILKEMPIRPHKVTYYLSRRDEDFDKKMSHVLMVYKEVQIVNEKEKSEAENASRCWSVISFDEKPGIQAVENTAPDLPPVPGKYSTMSRDYEYIRHGTVSLLAGIDLHTGHVTGLVRERHRSREFIEFLSALNEVYPENWKLRIILDNHSAHISKETIAWLKNYPNRFDFIYTPKHGSWLNLIEMFFSKMARSFLRSIRVKSKRELIDRIMLYLKEVNDDPVVFHWKYKMDETIV